MSRKPVVWLFGDVHIDTAYYDIHGFLGERKQRPRSSVYWRSRRQVACINYFSGTWLLHDILKQLFDDQVDLVSWSHRPEAESISYPRSVYRVAPFRSNPQLPAQSAPELVYRISENLGWVPLATEIRSDDSDAATDAKSQEDVRAAIEESPAPDLVVIYDRNNGFRNSIPARDLLSKLRELESPPIFLWARSFPFAENERGLLGNYLCNDVAHRTVSLVRGECLRQAGVNVLQDGSVEQFVESVFAARHSPIVQDLLRFSHTALYFRESVIHLCDANPNHASYHFCPYSVEEMWQPQMAGGQMRGYTAIMTGAVAAALCDSIRANPDGNQLECVVDDLEPTFLGMAAEQRQRQIPPVIRGLQLGQVLGTHHFREGYGTIRDMDRLMEQGISAGDTEPDSRISSPIPALFRTAQQGNLTERRQHRLSSLLFDNSVNERLSRVDSFLATAAKMHRTSAEEVLVDIVQLGLPAVVDAEAEPLPGGAPNDTDYLLQYPRPEVLCPYAEFGDVMTCDRREIEAYMSMYTLLYNYFQHGARDRPFSVAVFGPPGSGKSFAVKQIVRCVDAKSAENALEYNISQFSRPDDLMAVFHHIHDLATSNIVPLVILDEFDCPLNQQKLGWLKYFLAPMQDGTFKDRGEVFKVGRAIFLFAGGTAHTFTDFVESQPSDQEFRMSKGPDFVSRLRGHMDIESINAPVGSSVTNQLKMRRATLLRSLLFLRRKDAVRRETDEANIERELVLAFLNVNSFKHGVRSMEAILEMSTVKDGWLRKSSLPMDEQLNMHVDAEEFMTVVNEPRTSTAHK